MSVNSDLPLAGVRVLAFTQLGAGPWATMLLGDLGAEIVKVEDPTTGGDEARTVPPFNDPAAHDGLYFQALNRGARSLTLNLRHPEGQALLHRLVPRFDAVVAFYSLTHVPRADLPALLADVHRWLRPGGVLVTSMGAQDGPDEVEADWLGAPMFFSHYGAKRNRALVREAGFVLEEAVVESEPEDRHDALFLWVVARRPTDDRGVVYALGASKSCWDQPGRVTPRLASRGACGLYVSIVNTPSRVWQPSSRAASTRDSSLAV